MSLSTHVLRVAIVWGGTVHQEQTFMPTSDPSVFVGEGESNHFSLPAASLSEHFRMFERVDQNYRLHLPADMQASVQHGGVDQSWKSLQDDGATAETLDDLSSSTVHLGLDVGDWGVVELGHVELFFQVIEQHERVAGRGLSGAIDRPLLASVLASALVMGGVLLAAFLSFDPALAYEQPTVSDQWAQVLVDDATEPIDDVEPDDQSQRSSKAAGGEEGKVGAPELENETQLAKVEGPPREQLDPSNVGVTKALGSELLGGGPLKQIFGNEEGFDEKMNAAVAGDPGDFVVGRGARGMSMRGTGRGGPDDGNSFGQIGGLGGVDSGGRDPADAGLTAKQERRVEAVYEEGTPVSGEFCEPSAIQRVVSSKANAIKYCYEKQLQRHPDLSGKVVAQWKIGQDGSVISSSIANSTMESSSGGSREVERCLTRLVSRMRFEKPDGGICVINYPFVFTGVGE